MEQSGKKTTSRKRARTSSKAEHIDVSIEDVVNQEKTEKEPNAELEMNAKEEQNVEVDTEEGEQNVEVDTEEGQNADEEESTENSSGVPTTIKFQCPVCKCYFINKADYDKHSKKHKKKSKYKCKVCQFISRSGTSVLKHVRKKHPTILIKFKCDECDDEFMSNALLRAHKKENHCTVCELCGKDFSRRKYLTVHKKMRHTETFAKQFKCVNCSRTFVYAHQLKKHEDRYQGRCFSESMRPESEHYVCSMCNKGFVELDAFQKHEQMHKDKPYECPLCHVPSDSLQYIRQHLNKSHLGKVKSILFSCELCGKSYTRITALNEHIVNVHNGPRVYVCVICSASCTDRKDLEKHRGIHFECLHCGKRHRSENLLLKHQVKCKVRNKNCSETNDCKRMFQNTESMSALNYSGDLGNTDVTVDCPICKEEVSKAFLVDHLCSHAIKTSDDNNGAEEPVYDEPETLLAEEEEEKPQSSDSEHFEEDFYIDDVCDISDNCDNDVDDQLSLTILLNEDEVKKEKEEVEYKKPCIIKL